MRLIGLGSETIGSDRKRGAIESNPKQQRCSDRSSPEADKRRCTHEKSKAAASRGTIAVFHPQIGRLNVKSRDFH
jgi:hypothetical protein